MKMVADVPNNMQLSRIEVGETVAGIILDRVPGNDASDVSVAWR
jgi:hypothetical protein